MTDGCPARDGFKPVKPDIFNETSEQFPAVFVATKPVKAKHDLSLTPTNGFCADQTLTPNIKKHKVSIYLWFAEMYLANNYPLRLPQNENTFGHMVHLILTLEVSMN